jgi:hypothetical protein
MIVHSHPQRDSEISGSARDSRAAFGDSPNASPVTLEVLSYAEISSGSPELARKSRVFPRH